LASLGRDLDLMCLFVCSLNAAQEFEGSVINLKYARPKKEKTLPPVEQTPITFKLFVANLSYETRAKDLREFFDSGTSKVVSADVVFRKNPRRPAGYGFVSFKTKKEADEALSEFQGKVTQFLAPIYLFEFRFMGMCNIILTSLLCKFL
jgi:RNA recognition motif-containing protein